jgi:hypothetical protein
LFGDIPDSPLELATMLENILLAACEGNPETQTVEVPVDSESRLVAEARPPRRRIGGGSGTGN